MRETRKQKIDRQRGHAADRAFDPIREAIDSGELVITPLSPLAREVGCAEAVPTCADGESKDERLGQMTQERDQLVEVIQRVADLPDRTSPDDWPEAMLVTADELSAILLQDVYAPLLARLSQLTSERDEALKAMRVELDDETPQTVAEGIAMLVLDLNSEHERAEAAELQLSQLTSSRSRARAAKPRIAKGTAHEWDRKEASAAGRKGGRASRGGRGRLVS